MAKLLRLFLCLAFAVALATVSAQADGECDNDPNKDLIMDLVNQCKQFVMFPANPKIPPSDGCCGVIKKVNYECLCAKVTKRIEELVCMEKVVYVANYCKRPLEPGYQCGSYKVPGGQ